MSAKIRNYLPSDFSEIQRIHEENGIDYKLPNIGNFPVIKVLEVEGQVRAAYGLQHTLEAHLWLSRDSWADAESKWLTIKALDESANETAANLGYENTLCCVPPGYERFGRRLKNLGFSPIRDGWQIYTKRTGQ
jgi:hypothetical protein